MNSRVLLFAIFIGVLAIYEAESSDNFELDDAWRIYKAKYNKNYESASEEQNRRLIWESKFLQIEKHNAEEEMGLHTYRQGLNEFSDLTHDEFKARFHIGRGKPHSANTKLSNDAQPAYTAPLPTSIDWRKKGCVTAVIDQGQCGSSWAFAATGAIEGQHAKKTKKLVSVSAQQLLDCSTPEGNNGCEGGLMDQSFTYVIKNKGIDSTEAYPYEATDGKCRFNPKKVVATLSSYGDIESQNETALQVAVATIGPVSIAVDATPESFQSYTSGVFSDPTCDNKNPNHGALIVGYGESATQGPYWIMKNTWGPSWGMDGYILIARNKSNMCGIATFSSYAIA